MNKMLNRFVSWLLVAAVACSSSVFAQQKRGPSTLEERATAVRLTRALEAEPLAKDAKETRKRLFLWLVEIPDITVSICTDFLKPLDGNDKNYSTEISMQMMYSSAAFIIEHPDQAKNRQAVYKGGLEGSLRVYESILRTKPKARWDLLDKLIARRDARTLGDYVTETRKTGCKSE